MRRRFNRRRGFALLLVLLVLGLAVVLGVSYVSSTSVKLAGTSNLLLAGQAQCLAESGLDHSLYYLRASPWVMENSDVIPVGPFFVDSVDNQYFCIAVAQDEAAGIYDVAGLGSTGGIQRRVSARVRIRSSYAELLKQYAPLAYWRLGETSGSAAADQMGCCHGTYENNVLQGERGAINGDADTAAGFDGSNDYVDVGDVDTSGDRVTVIAWVRLNGPCFSTSQRQIAARASGTAEGDCCWALGIRECFGTAELRFVLRTDEAATIMLIGSERVYPSRWLFVAGTYDREQKKIRLYQNGREVAVADEEAAIAENDSAVVWIGGLPFSANVRPWKGTIDEVAIFDRALTPEEIRLLYEAREPSLEVLSCQ